MTASVRRRWWSCVALVAAAVALSGVALAPASGAAAAPSFPGDEGSVPLLDDVIANANRGYVQAKNALDKSRQRQLQLQIELTKAEQRIKEMEPEIALVASTSYRNGRVGAMSLLLNSASPEGFLERAETLELLAMRDDAKIRALNEATAEVSRAKQAIDAAVADEQKQLAVLAKQKKDAEAALREAGIKATGGVVAATSPVARPAPRNSDGEFPSQSCSVKDPTTGRCITPRTLHMLKETQRVGFKRFVSCYRSGGPYEHPKGRACDFSSEVSNFGGDATGKSRLYGNNLAAFFVRNADRLGVMYVIWYRQFWSPATGWKAYTGAYGDPSSDHTNHVHISML
ncbi:hypothetical protein WEI85_42355 [Actinomycetes bacterium KLBMP 9797]